MVNNPWDETDAWKNSSQYYNWLRGQLRKIWSDYPVRKNFKTEMCRPVTQEEKDAKLFHPSTKTVGQCVFCKNWFSASKLEVDHKQCSNGCKNKEEAEQFLWYCAGVSKSGMQLSCKPCHSIKSYSERQGITFEEAVIGKQVLAFSNLKSQEQVSLLSELGLSGKNGHERKALYKKYLEDK